MERLVIGVGGDHHHQLHCSRSSSAGNGGKEMAIDLSPIPWPDHVALASPSKEKRLNMGKVGKQRKKNYNFVHETFIRVGVGSEKRFYLDLWTWTRFMLEMNKKNRENCFSLVFLKRDRKSGLFKVFFEFLSLKGATEPTKRPPGATPEGFKFIVFTFELESCWQSEGTGLITLLASFLIYCANIEFWKWSKSCATHPAISANVEPLKSAGRRRCRTRALSASPACRCLSPSALRFLFKRDD